jgi:agmatine deiminase
MWARDSGPTFVLNEAGRLVVADMNFNGWGNMVGEIRRRIRPTRGSRKRLPSIWESGVSMPVSSPRVELSRVDGEGTLVATESSILNDNRNPGLDKLAIERRLRAFLGAEKVLWLPGLRGRDITDAHIDFLVRFVRPGVVIVERPGRHERYDRWAMMTLDAIEMLRHATDARGRRLEVIVMDQPLQVRSEVYDFAGSYANFYVCNGAVIIPEFGDPSADQKAIQQLAEVFPGRRIVQVDVDRICENGGGIHCVTQQQPSV